MPLTTGSIVSGVPTGDGSVGDPFVWTGKVAETFSAQVYSKAFESYLLSKVTRVSAASAFLLRRLTVLEAGSATAEGDTTPETNIKGETQRAVLSTYRAQQKISAELLADSDAMQAVSERLAMELAEQVTAACADAIEADSYNTAGAAYRDNVQSGSVTNGVPAPALLSSLAFGIGTAANGLAAGARFSQDMRSRLVFLMDATSVREFLAGTVTGNYGGHHGFSDGMLTYAGIPICTTVGLLGNASTAKGGLHVVCVDPKEIILAEQPMVVAVDTESLAQNNQVLISAAYRAAAFLSIRTNATGATLRTMA